MKTRLLLFIDVTIIAFLVTNCNPQQSGKDFQDSEILWRFEIDDPITSTPTTGDSLIYIRTLSSINAINPVSGTVIWKAASQAQSSLSLQPIVYKTYLVVPEKDNQIAVFSSEEGTLLWRSSLIDPPYTHPSAIDIQAIGVLNDILFVARFDWALTAYSLSSGSVLWEYEQSSRSNPYLSVGENIIFLGIGSKIVALDSKNGKQLWEYNLDGYVGPLAYDDGILYILDERNSAILALDTYKHTTIWDLNLPAESYEFNCILVQPKNIYIASQNLISVSKKDGRLLWKSKSTGRLECPIVWENIVLIRNNSTDFFILNGDSGKIINKYNVLLNKTAKHEPDRSPAIFNNLILIQVSTHELIAMDLITLEKDMNSIK